MRVFDFTMDGVTVKLGVPNERTMEAHIDEGATWAEKHKTEPIAAAVWTARRRTFLASVLNAANGSSKYTADGLAEEFDPGMLNGMMNAIYERCGIKMSAVGEAKAIA